MYKPSLHLIMCVYNKTLHLSVYYVRSTTDGNTIVTKFLQSILHIPYSLNLKIYVCKNFDVRCLCKTAYSY